MEVKREFLNKDGQEVNIKYTKITDGECYSIIRQTPESIELTVGREEKA